MSRSYGIDLGTTNSVISVLENGRPVPLPVDGNPIVPSVVSFSENGGVAVGREARNLELLHPERTIRSVKRRMGTNHSYQVQGRALTPEEVSAEILKALAKGAQLATGEPVTDVVITVPAYFGDAQRKATLEAGRLAGLNVLRLLNEPTSASLIYGIEEPASDAVAEPEIVLVYDLGGGTFDVSVIEVFQGVREVRATAGNTALGGDDFDELLVRRFLDEVKTRHQLDLRDDARAMARLRRVAESTKIALSADTEVRVREEFLAMAGQSAIHLESIVTRRQLESLLQPLLESTIELSRRAMDDARLDGQRLGKILLVGGSTRIPMVRRLLEEAFDAPVHEEVDADLAVGLGACVQAGLLRGESVARLLVDVSAHSLGIRVVGDDDEFRSEPDTFAPVLRRNTALPAERTEEFATLIDGQEKIQVEVFQGESRRVSQNVRVGAFDFLLKPVEAGSPVRVAFSYDPNGVVKVSISQPGHGNEKTVALSVANAALAAQDTSRAVGPAVASALERKAAALLEEMAPGERGELNGLLQRFRAATGDARLAAEEALLDFFLAWEDEDGGDKDVEDLF